MSLGETVSAVAEGWVVVASDSGVKADSVDDCLCVKPLHLGVGVHLVEVAHPQCKVGIGEQLDRLGFVNPMYSMSTFSLSAPSCKSPAKVCAACVSLGLSGSVPTIILEG